MKILPTALTFTLCAASFLTIELYAQDSSVPIRTEQAQIDSLQSVKEEKARDEQRMAEIKSDTKDTKAKAKDAQRIEREASAAARESKLALKAEKKAQSARTKADKQARKAETARSKSNKN
jgi:hypothetical protein